jgi:hypothetical protein
MLIARSLTVYLTNLEGEYLVLDRIQMSKSEY